MHIKKIPVQPILNSAAENARGVENVSGGAVGMREAERKIDKSRRAGACKEADHFHILPAYQVVIES